MSNDSHSDDSLIVQLLNRAAHPRIVTAEYRFWKPARLLEPYDLLFSLGISKDHLSPVAQEVLRVNEDDSFGAKAEWTKLLWSLSAFLEIQDVFEIALSGANDTDILFQQDYFYHESRVLLAESFLSGLNGFYAASDALLRPFLEFNLLQLYYRAINRKANSYSSLEDYFRHRRSLKWSRILGHAIPKDSFCRPIRSRIEAHLQGLSASISHAYHPDHSPSQHRPEAHGHSLEGIFFWHKARMIVDAVLWAYFVNYPMVFFPVDLVRKFGLNGPVGFFANQQCGEIVRRCLSSNDYAEFRQYAAGLADVLELRTWVDGRPDLSDEEIREQWNETIKGPYPGICAAFGETIAKLRATRVALAFRKRQDVAPSEEIAQSLETLQGWRSVQSSNAV